MQEPAGRTGDKTTKRVLSFRGKKGLNYRGSTGFGAGVSGPITHDLLGDMERYSLPGV